MAEAESRSRFWWLWHNGFYESTVLLGYAFINDAKTKVEALLWYATIIILSIFTINNVINLVHYYLSKPTKTEVRFASDASDATIGNLTLKLKLPITEIHSANPLLNWWNDNRPLSCQGSALLNKIEEASYESSSCLAKYITPLLNTYNPDLVQIISNENLCKMPRDSLNLTYTSIVETEKLIQLLHNRFSETLTGIWSKMTTYKNGNNYKQNLFNAAKDFNDLMAETVESNFFTPFLLLKSMSDATIHSDLPFMELFNATQYFKHSALSPKETLEEISARLLDIAPFSLPNASLSDTQVFVRDWKVDFGDRTKSWNKLKPSYKDEDSSWYRDIGNSFTLEFHLRPPDGRKEFTVDINPPKQLIKFLFPFIHMDNFVFVCKDTPRCSPNFIYNLLSCHIIDWGGDIDLSWSGADDWFDDYIYPPPRTDFLEKFVYPAVDFYKRHSELKVNTGGGQVTLKPFHKYHINQLPMGRMISQTDDCISITFGECVDLCQTNYTVEKCQCYPWKLHYLHTQSDIAICNQPCPGLAAQKELCLRKCEQLSAHPCDQIIYRPEIILQPITALEENTPSDYHLEKGRTLLDELKLFSVKITIEQITAYVKTLEKYEMTFTNFLSEFGGLVDFWLGVNLIGIMHAFVYFFKHCYHCNREHKTGTARSVSYTNSNNEVGPMEEEEQQSGAGATPNMLATIHQQMDERNREIAEENRNQNKRFIKMMRKSEEKIMKEINNINTRIKHIEDRLEKH